MKRWIFLALIAMFTLVLAACGAGEDGSEEGQQQEDSDTEEQTEEGSGSSENTEEGSSGASSEEVEVSMQNNDGEETATATLTEDDSGVNIALEGENLSSGEKGFHIHNSGACETPDFESAGDHYNPTDANHGFDDPDGPHAGDLENIEVSEDGTVSAERTADMVTLEEGQDNTLFTEDGTALVIHSEADDYESQPSGDAGDRIACGVIEQ